MRLNGYGNACRVQHMEGRYRCVYAGRQSKSEVVYCVHRDQRKFVRGRRLRCAFPIGSRWRDLPPGGLHVGCLRCGQWAPETGLKMVRGAYVDWKQVQSTLTGGAAINWTSLLPGQPWGRPRRSTHHAPSTDGADHRTFRGTSIFPPSACDQCEAIQKHRTTRPSWRFPESPGRE